MRDAELALKLLIMLNTKNLVSSESNVPSYWVFHHYLNLPEQLSGQDIKIKSIFNPGERTPSMCIYVDKSIMQYKYKDFSTGKYGSKIDLVKELFNLDYSQAVNKIVEDYNTYAKAGIKKTNFKIAAKWEIDFVKTRHWLQHDADYWLAYNIGSTLLDEYNVRPIEYYNMVKEDDGEVKSLSIEGKNMYGYFDKDGNIYKIYQPFSKKHKFHKVKSYLQGYDQLKFDKPYLVICSSLKDAMCLRSFNYKKIEVIAPDSENTMIKPYIVENLKKKYEKIITLFDNDEAGNKAIERYTEVYNINGCTLTICKDISDAVKQHTASKINNNLKTLLISTLKL